ncbi:MAG TPA: MBOAT family O-acyltransferase [Myxococcota bacterium]|nr:MBOAT family O-acyltransferase [Myxococcota bacterium]
MRFNSFEFALFFAVLVGLLPFFPRGKPRTGLLLVASYIFYGSWNWGFLLLLWLTTLLDFGFGLAISATEVQWKRRAYLWTSIFANLGFLFYFKYGNFFLDNVAFVSGIDPEPYYLKIVIPLGISFYTFHTMTYTIDVYRRRVETCRSLLDFALYVAFFPQLLAGPILRAGHFIPQLARTEPVRDDELLSGLELFCLGLFKKVVVADNMATLADRVFSDPTHFGAAAILLGTIAFWIQIYCDFSGYSTMARGLGRWLGFEIPQNFDYPLLQTNPQTYRHAWHMTLGQWFTDYVYKPLGGSRAGDLRMLRNIMITWTLTGLWHGASWHFVLWGLYNGVTLCVYSLWKKHAPWHLPEYPGKKLVSWLAQVALLLPSVALFRTGDMHGFGQLALRVLSWESGRSVALEWPLAIALLAGVHVLCYFHYKEDLLQRLRWPARIGLVSSAAALTALLAATGRPFIYFQF